MVILLGMVLRVYRGDEYPINQNDDGLFHVWAGNSTLDNWHQPTSLTIFENKNQNLIWRSQYKSLDPINQFGFRLTSPWFDQPILATLFIALPARFFGFTNFTQIPQFLVRTPAFIAALASLTLTYFLAKQLFDDSVGILSTLVLAVWPLAVWSSRQSFLENILTPIWLISLWSLWRYLQNQNINNLKITLIANALSGWTKIIGFMGFIVTAFWTIKARHTKTLTRIITTATITLTLYFLYGHVIGDSSFWTTITSQSSRGAYMGSLFHILTHPETFHGVITDGWWFLGILALIWLLGKSEAASRFIATNAIFWLVVVVLTSGPSNTSPWYRYPIFPLMAIALGVVIKEMITKPQPAWLLIVAMLGLTGWELSGISVSSFWFRLGGLILLATIMLEAGVKHPLAKFVRKTVVIGLLIITIIGNITAIIRVPQHQCESGECVRPTRIVLPS